MKILNYFFIFGKKYMVIPITARIGKRIVNNVITEGSATSVRVIADSFNPVALKGVRIVFPASAIKPIANGKIVAITIRLIAIKITFLTLEPNLIRSLHFW